MSFFELVDQLFQLNCQQPVPPAAVKLYLYWLNEFNQQRWPAVLYRRANQVYADLPCDKNTFSRAVAQLAERGLLRFDSDTRAWALNYGPAAEWVAGTVVNFSPQPPAAVVKNSPSAAQGMVKNSPSDAPESGETLLSVVKNSPPIRNKPTSSGVNQPTPSSASACVGEAAEKIAHAPLPTETSELVPPVAEPPHAAESRPVAAAELPAALLAEVKALANEMGKLWKVNEQHGFASWQRLYSFAKHHAQQGTLPELRRQLAGYVAGHLRPGSGLRPHQLDKWLGSPQHPDGPYSNGQWCSCDWPAVAAETLAVAGGAAPLDTRATTVARNDPNKKW